MFYDTHVHFDERDGERGYRVLVRRALDAGVTRMLAVGGDPRMNGCALEAADTYPEHVRAAIGCDRDTVRDPAGGMETIERDVSSLKAQLEQDSARVVALGEVGLDFHYGADTAHLQQMLVERQLALARSLQLPVIVHSREADNATLRALTAHREAWRADADRIGVLHCFTGNETFARALLALGYYISFSGIVTFRNAEPLRRVAAIIPHDRILIETDTPYLAPVPFRGKANEPAYVNRVAAVLATVRKTSEEEVAARTCANAERLFTR